MSTLLFSKYQGTGNDFVIIDNRINKITLSTQQIKLLCHPKFGIGADGLILLQNKPNYDFEMVYFNSDGSTSTMCGNGGRCIAQFAKDIGINKPSLLFLASDGDHKCNFNSNGWVHLKMKDVDSVKNVGGNFIVNTGSPHFINNTSHVKKIDVALEGSKIRYSKEFEQLGINVNFVEVVDEDNLFVRTYERGVEAETLSCGTGVTAAALVNYHNENGFNRIEVETLGGSLAVEFNKIGTTKYNDIWLCGPAKFVFKGEINI
jgi:diaminopimelate epimerase